MRWKNLPGLLSGDFREVAAIASLLLADRSRNTAAIAAAIDPVLRDNPNANLLEIEQAFRDSAAAAYLVATTERFGSARPNGDAGGGCQSQRNPLHADFRIMDNQVERH